MRVRLLGSLDGPPVLLLHGSPLPSAYLEGLARFLAVRHRVLVPDLPGYGDSPRVEHVVADAHTLLEAQLRGVGTVDLVGVGLGAYRALRLALGGTVPVRRVVAVSGFAALPGAERRRCLAYADILESGGDLCDLLIAHALAAEQRDTDPQLVERCRTWAHGLDPRTWIAELDAMSSLPDLVPHLPDLRGRLLAIHGEVDGVVAPARGRELAAAAGHDPVMLPCGHLPLAELPDTTMRLVAAYLAR